MRHGAVGESELEIELKEGGGDLLPVVPSPLRAGDRLRKPHDNRSQYEGIYFEPFGVFRLKRQSRAGKRLEPHSLLANG